MDDALVVICSPTLTSFCSGEGFTTIARGEISLSIRSCSFPVLEAAFRVGVLGVIGSSGFKCRANPRCEVVAPSTGETPATVAAVDEGGVIGRLKGTLEKGAPAVTGDGPSDTPTSGVVDVICPRTGVIDGLKDELSDSRSLALLP